MRAMKKAPEIGRYLDDDENALVQAFETSDAPVKSGLTPKRKREIETMARATMTDERAKISVRVPKRDLTRLNRSECMIQLNGGARKRASVRTNTAQLSSARLIAL
jgi:hypothetical protein